MAEQPALTTADRGPAILEHHACVADSFGHHGSFIRDRDGLELTPQVDARPAHVDGQPEAHVIVAAVLVGRFAPLRADAVAALFEA